MPIVRVQGHMLHGSCNWQTLLTSSSLCWPGLSPIGSHLHQRHGGHGTSKNWILIYVYVQKLIVASCCFILLFFWIHTAFNETTWFEIGCKVCLYLRHSCRRFAQLLLAVLISSKLKFQPATLEPAWLKFTRRYLLGDIIIIWCNCFFCHPQPWVIDTLYLFLLSSTLIIVGGVGEFRVKVMVVISPAFQGSRRGTRTQTCSWCLIQQYRHRIYPKSRSSLNTYRSTQRRLIKSEIYNLRTENQSWFTHSWYTHSSLKGGEKELVPSTGVSGLGFSLSGGWVVYHNVCIPKLCIPKCLYTKMLVQVCFNKRGFRPNCCRQHGSSWNFKSSKTWWNFKSGPTSSKPSRQNRLTMEKNHSIGSSCQICHVGQFGQIPLKFHMWVKHWSSRCRAALTTSIWMTDTIGAKPLWQSLCPRNIASFAIRVCALVTRPLSLCNKKWGLMGSWSC